MSNFQAVFLNLYTHSYHIYSSGKCCETALNAYEYVSVLTAPQTNAISELVLKETRCFILHLYDQLILVTLMIDVGESDCLYICNDLYLPLIKTL